MTNIAARLPVVMNRFSWILTFFLAGYAVHATKYWPYTTIDGGLRALSDLTLNAAGYLGLIPTRHVFYEPRQGQGVTIHEPARVEPGVTFVTGFFDKKHVMKLMSADGNERHRWTVNFAEIFPSKDHILPSSDRPFHDWLTHIHGAHVFADGSVVFNFDQHGLVRIDACGDVQWKIARMTHHSVSLADDETLWVPARVYQTETQTRLPLHRAPFFEDQLLQVSQDGRILKEISLPELLYKNDLYGAVFANGFQNVGNEFPDFMHTNDAEILTKDVAAAFPQFQAGDIAVSMRQLNLVFVFDPVTEMVKWYQTGPWWRQHDPDFLADGTISIFNNRSDDTLLGHRLGGSQITTVNPATRAVRTRYAQPDGDGRRRFFTNIMGKHQHLANGNILVTESLGGRIFEVAPEGDIVWQYINRFDDDHVALVTGATRYPVSYFKWDTWSCPASGEKT